MIIKLLLVLLIIFIAFLFLIFFKSWHIHIIFKNENLDYFYRIIIKFLLFNIAVFTVEKRVHVLLQITLFSKTIKVFEYKLKDKSSDSAENESTESTKEESSGEENIEKIKNNYSLFYDAKKDLLSIVQLLVKMVKFDESWLIMNLGLKDNNLTIKFCTLLWTLFAPLYPLGLKLILTPEINKSIIKTDMNIKFDIFLFNILKILFLIIRRKKLREIMKLFM